MIKFKIPHFQLKLQKHFLMFLNTNQAYHMRKKCNNFVLFHSYAQGCKSRGIYVEFNMTIKQILK
jgi:hypothetical protein